MVKTPLTLLPFWIMLPSETKIKIIRCPTFQVTLNYRTKSNRVATTNEINRQAIKTVTKS